VEGTSLTGSAGHQGAALELTADSRVDTFWPPPVRLDANLTVRLHALELRDVLLDYIPCCLGCSTEPLVMGCGCM
jgi:hypothetical protein